MRGLRSSLVLVSFAGKGLDHLDHVTWDLGPQWKESHLQGRFQVHHLLISLGTCTLQILFQQMCFWVCRLFWSQEIELKTSAGSGALQEIDCVTASSWVDKWRSPIYCSPLCVKSLSFLLKTAMPPRYGGKICPYRRGCSSRISFEINLNGQGSTCLKTTTRYYYQAQRSIY